MTDIWALLIDYIHSGSISNVGIIILIILSLVQIAPIKLNPYDRFFLWLRKKLLGDTNERLDRLWINFYRQHILRFARESRQGAIHTHDEWHYVLNMASEYEKYCEDNNIVNGVIQAETDYIRELYQECSKEGKFV